MANILIVDDDGMICETLSRWVTSLGHHAASAQNLKDAIWMASREAFDVVFLDVDLPDGSGLEQLPKIRATASNPEVIIITGAGDPEGAEIAVKSGAWDYNQKPISKEDIALQLVRTLQYRQEKSLPKAPVVLKREGIVGRSPQINASLDLLAQAARGGMNVVITGETGVGKELFARALHENSIRSDGNFVVVDCTSLPDSLVESTLFGYEKGAYTGADKTQEGLLRQADGGTLFLDEVGELPQSIQGRFLRALQEHRFRPVGAKKETVSDFRLVSATNRDLDDMVNSGSFRSDLLFRLRTFSIELPPLRARTKDIRELTVHYATKLCERNGLESKGFSPEFFDALLAYDWPGNVRELVNTLERALSFDSNSPILYPKQLPNHIRIKIISESITKEEAPAPDGKRSHEEPEPLPTLKDLREASIAELERNYLNDLMFITKGHIKKACGISGLGRARLYELMKKYKISRPLNS